MGVLDPEGTLVLASVCAFVMAYAIGANDVANSIATSVGAKALTVRKAIVMAGICEFAGASLLGSQVTSTISKGIVNPEVFAGEPLIFMIGMLSALLAASFWLLVATFFALPVSTTHSIVGGVIGFTIVAKGFDVLDWSKIGFIASSWVVSPILGCMLAFVPYFLVDRKILKSNNPLERSLKAQPSIYAICISMMSVFVVYETIPNLGVKVPFYVYIIVPFTTFAVTYAIAFFVIVPYYRRKVEGDMEKISLIANGKARTPAEVVSYHLGVSADTEAVSEEIKIVYTTFVPIQILTSALMAFAHGANDVANAVGPIAAIIATFENNDVTSSASAPFWLLIAGGAGIVIGLATMGYRVMTTMGKKITHLDPACGFTAEFATASTVLIASALGLPISTTHTLVGAITGVGLVNGVKNLDWKVIRNIFASWIITIPAGVGVSMLAFLALRALT